MSVICCADSKLRFLIEYLRLYKMPIISPDKLHAYLHSHTVNQLFIAQNTEQFPSLDNLPEHIQINVINTEQLSCTDKRNTFLTLLSNLEKQTRRTVRVYDYSTANTVYLKSPFTLSPYLNNQPETILLESLLLSSPKRYDIAFIGHPSSRRMLVLQQLRERGFTIWFSNQEFGIERDIQVAQCKLLLNIHWSETACIFESIRCNRWLFAGLPVITEQSIDKPNHPLLTIASYDDLVETVQRVLKA